MLGELERQARDLIGAEVERLNTMLAQVRFYCICFVLYLHCNLVPFFAEEC